MSTSIKHIVILGPQGSGKGTQAEFLAAALNLLTISTGHLFRSEVEAKTPLGLEITEKMKDGVLISDEIINKMVAERLAKPDCKNGYILDGYPRTLAQAEFLETIAAPDCVLEIDITDEEAMKRLANRLTCPKCGRVYHPEFKRPRAAGKCDACAADLITRPDDTAEATERRLAKYRDEVSGILKYYGKKGVLIKIDGAPAIEEVKKDVFKQLGLEKAEGKTE
jgi:adenylate kinase